MNNITVAKYSFYGNCAILGLMIAFDQETAYFFGLMNMQVLWAALGSVMLGVFFHMIVLLHAVLVSGEKHLNVRNVLREANLYQMENT